MFMALRGSLASVAVADSEARTEETSRKHGGRNLALSMNRTRNRTESGRFWLENHIVLAGQLLEQPLFGLSDFLFIFVESLFHVTEPVNHQPPGQFGQLASQGKIGNQAAAAPLEPSVKATERFINATAHAPSDHAEQPSSSVTSALLIAPPLATLTATRRQAQPGGEVLLGLPVLAQIGSYFSQQLQQHVISHSGQSRQIFVSAQTPQQRMQSADLWRIDSTSLGCRRSRFCRIFRAAYFLKHLGDGLVALGDLLLIELPQLIGLAQCKEVLLFPS